MSKHLAALLVGAAVLVAGCGSTSGGDQDGDGGDGDAHPTGPPWPAYEVDDYTYTLRTSCFCAYAGDPVLVTVRDGEVVDAVYTRRGHDHAPGDAAEEWMRVTIEDVIDAANDEDAYRVQVRWPEGQDYPSYVWIDQDGHMADEEIGYRIDDVTPA
ncbi:DUF6174 domain-containing protein [Nocardioides sp.]|uniref:DUF6174 domain-containing protein n=1 Tax=Nocardioides sp. TaxID=35761 RepID=UPI0037840E94